VCCCWRARWGCLALLAAAKAKIEARAKEERFEREQA
jgi:hypothetical protein